MSCLCTEDVMQKFPDRSLQVSALRLVPGTAVALAWLGLDATVLSGGASGSNAGGSMVVDGGGAFRGGAGIFDALSMVGGGAVGGSFDLGALQQPAVVGL